MTFPNFCSVLQTFSKGLEDLIRHPGLAGFASVVLLVWERQLKLDLCSGRNLKAEISFLGHTEPCSSSGSYTAKSLLIVIDLYEP